MYETRAGRQLHTILIAQMKRGEISGAQARLVFEEYSDAVPILPVLTISRAPQRWRDLSRSVPFEVALQRWRAYLHAKPRELQGGGVAIGRPQHGPGSTILLPDGLRGGLGLGPAGAGAASALGDIQEDGWSCICCPGAPRAKKAAQFEWREGRRVADLKYPPRLRKKYRVPKHLERNGLLLEVTFELGVLPGGALGDSILEWWEMPSASYVGRKLEVGRPPWSPRRSRSTLVALDVWNLLDVRGNPGFIEWDTRTPRLQELCSDDDRTITITLRDTPAIKPRPNYRRIINIVVLVYSGTAFIRPEADLTRPVDCIPHVSCRILVDQKNNRRGGIEFQRVRQLKPGEPYQATVKDGRVVDMIGREYHDVELGPPGRIAVLGLDGGVIPHTPSVPENRRDAD